MNGLLSLLVLIVVCCLSSAFVLQELPLDRWERSDPDTRYLERAIRSDDVIYRHLFDRYFRGQGAM